MSYPLPSPCTHLLVPVRGRHRDDGAAWLQALPDGGGVGRLLEHGRESVPTNSDGGGGLGALFGRDAAVSGPESDVVGLGLTGLEEQGLFEDEYSGETVHGETLLSLPVSRDLVVHVVVGFLWDNKEWGFIIVL